MIVTDLDGTLLRDDKRISYQTIELLNQWRTRGNLVVLATARPVRAVKSFVEDDIYDAGIYHNGAVIISGESYIAGCGIENINEVIKRLLNINYHAEIAIESEDKLYANFDANAIWPESKYMYTCDFRELYNKTGDKIIVKLMSNDQFYEYQKILPDNLYISKTDSTIGMIMNKNATKSNGILMLKKLYNIRSENIYVFGDDFNDIDMLENNIMSIAVDNACPEVKKAANYQTKSNNEDGVAEWIRKNIEF